MFSYKGRKKVMLDDKLEQARERNRAQRKKVVLAGVSVVVFMVLSYFVYLGVMTFVTHKGGGVSSGEEEQLSHSTEPATKQQTEQPLVDPEQLRTEFKEQLKVYESEIEPQIPRGKWMAEEVFEIDSLKKTSLSHFSVSDYQRAVDSLTTTAQKAHAVIAKTEIAFKEAMQQAQGALEQDNYDGAKLSIERALTIKTSDTDALALQTQIEKLPQILALLEGAQTARIENNYLKEKSILEEIVVLAPKRTGVVERIEELEQLIKNEGFSYYIAAGFSAVEKGQATEARRHYKKAKEIDPQRQELQLLQSQLLTLERQIRVRSALKKAEQATRRDDWASAQKWYQKAAQDVPQNAEVVDGIQLAQKILNSQKALTKHLSSPYRLTTATIKSQAQRSIDEAKKVEKYSFSLQQQSKDLQYILEKMSRDISVTVLSDKKTYVDVRGVGKVGEIESKVIRLKPGTYSFGGARKGYVEKLIKVLIPYNVKTFEVRVVCDQPI